MNHISKYSTHANKFNQHARAPTRPDRIDSESSRILEYLRNKTLSLAISGRRPRDLFTTIFAPVS
jgi:hypothetical protein